MKTAMLFTLFSVLLLIPNVHSGQATEPDDVNALTLIREFLTTERGGDAWAHNPKPSTNKHAPPGITFADAFLKNGDTLWVECNILNPDMGLPTLDAGAVHATSACPGEALINFKQTQVSKGVGEPGILKLYRLSWIVVDGCGNTDSVQISLALIDTIAPRIHGVPQKITGNLYEMPPPFVHVFASDECQCEILLTVEDTVLNPGSLNGHVIVRSWTAIDQSGNVTTATQTFTLTNETSPYFLISQH